MCDLHHDSLSNRQNFDAIYGEERCGDRARIPRLPAEGSNQLTWRILHPPYTTFPFRGRTRPHRQRGMLEDAVSCFSEVRRASSASVPISPIGWPAARTSPVNPSPIREVPRPAAKYDWSAMPSARHQGSIPALLAKGPQWSWWPGYRERCRAQRQIGHTPLKSDSVPQGHPGSALSRFHVPENFVVPPRDWP